MEKPHDYDPIWEEIYSSGNQLNRYPYDDVVSFIFRHAPKNTERKNIKIFEVGFGAGNNLWFAAREGFDTYGVEPSQSACDYASKRFAEDGLKGSMILGDCSALPFEDNFFDLAINRLALPCVPKSVAQKAVNEIRRCLKPNGVFLNNLFSDKFTIFGEERDDGVIIMDDKKGWIPSVGQQTFYSEEEIKNMHSDKWRFIELLHTERTDAVQPEKGTYAIWHALCEKIE